MRRKSYALKTALFIACTGLLATGCRKLYDYIGSHGDGDYKICNVKKVTSVNKLPGDSTIRGRDTVIYTFAYNRLGNPVSITLNKTTTGDPNYIFHYDRYNRLSEMIQPYSGGGNYELWDRYGYNDKGQIVTDTSYAFGGIVNGVPQPSVWSGHFTYEYDAKGRMIRAVDSTFVGGGSPFAVIHNYTYDANGDLVTGQAYDNKLSINRTNSVWMFIKRDYSLHNPFTATQYNNNELPTAVVGQIRLLPAAGPDIHIEYLCD